MSTWSNITAEQLTDQYKYKKNGFFENVIKELHNMGLDDEEIKDFNEVKNERFRLVPDLYDISYEDGNIVITAIEIEDENKLSVEKLDKYLEMWFMLDSMSDAVKLRLKSLDRYGNTLKDHDLCELYYIRLREEIEEGRRSD